MKPFKTFANPKILGNPLLWLTNAIVSPLARLLVKANISPKSVTHLSNTFFLVSLYFFLNNNPLAFSALLIVSFIMDVADGMVARYTNTSSARGSLYDHSSDDIKIFILLFVVGTYYNIQLIWFLTFFASSLILLVSSNSYAHAFKNSLNSIHSKAPKENYIEDNLPFSIKRFFKGLISSVFRLDGNFMYYFFFLNPNHMNLTIIILIFIIIVITSNLIYGYIRLYRQATHIDKKSLKWK